MPYKPKEVLKVLIRLGFIEQRQSGSHILLEHPDGRVTIVAMHGKTMKKGTFRSILKDAKMTEQDFRNLR